MGMEYRVSKKTGDRISVIGLGARLAVLPGKIMIWRWQAIPWRRTITGSWKNMRRTAPGAAIATAGARFKWASPKKWGRSQSILDGRWALH